MKKIVLFILTIFYSQLILSQEIPIFHWQDHLSYKSGVVVAEGDGKVYYASTSGIFSYNKIDNSMNRMSKVNGLSDVEATVMNFNHFNNKLLIAYYNSNIDIVTSTGAIVNISDIKNKNISGSKNIYNVYFINQFAYLACGFGIVVLDMNKLEISDTYYIGTSGNSLKVRDITSDDNYLYAATDSGIRRAPINSPNLANYSVWNTMAGLPVGVYNTIASVNGKIYTNLSKHLALPTPVDNKDVIYKWNGIAWVFKDSIDSINYPNTNYICYRLKSNNNELIIVNNTSAVTIDGSGWYQVSFINGNGDTVYGIPNDAALDGNGAVWIADAKFGLVSWKPSIGFQYRYPNGPGSPSIFNMNLSGGNLLIAPGGVTNNDANLYYADGIYNYQDNNWTNINGNYPPLVNMGSFYDILNVLVDPNNPKHTYAASWGNGVLELYDGKPIKLYNKSNSLLQVVDADTNAVWTKGLALDEEGGLWITNSRAKYKGYLVKKSAAGNWTSLDFSNLLGAQAIVNQVLIDKSDQKWFIEKNGGIIVYAGHTTAKPDASNSKKMVTGNGKGALPSSNVICMAEDNNGEIWVGTDKGIAVFYSPENVFTGQNYDCQQILLEQDGHVQILLETELIQSIAVDDANRKWIATANSGVFLMSADGTQQIYHFDESNSPLFSNDVRSIVINHETGEVYFGTGKGLIAFRGSATKPSEDCSDLYAFPDPVKHDYQGPVVIKGLSDKSTVKITDVSGTLVYQTKSEGGQALWYSTNFKGERVSTGVYMIFSTSEDGSQKCVSKILVIN